MNVNDTIVLVLIIVVVIAAIIYFAIKRSGKTNRVRSLLKTHPEKIKLFIDEDETPTLAKLTEYGKDFILSIPDEEWKEWDALIKSVQNLGSLYPETLNEFINDYLPQVKKRKSYKKKIAYSANPQRMVTVAIDCMLLEELRLIDADSEETWKHRDDLRIKATQIKKVYPDGYLTYCEIQKNYNPNQTEIVRNRKQIIELQSFYDKSKKFEGWEEKQRVFSSRYWKILKDVRSQDGRYPYNVPFFKPTKRGALVESEFKVWQGFTECFSSFLIDRQVESFLKVFHKISEFENQNRYFVDRVYEEIFQIIKAFDEAIEGETYVIQIDRCKRNWSSDTYNYHYRHIRELLDESGIHRLNFTELATEKDEGNIGGIFILDFITSNDELKTNCKLIIEHFKKSAPFIGYYSMEKEYDEEELIELAEKNEGYLKNDEKDEEADTNFIRNCLLQVNKHQFFTYVAIPNTWIGEAGNSEQTKEKWLNNPDQYDFRVKDKQNYISGEYSIDGGNSYQELSIIGSESSVDDVARYTYLLFIEMGVLDEFKENGHYAIEYMNSIGSLAYH